MAELAGCHLADRVAADRPGGLRFVRPWGPFAAGEELVLPDGDGSLATRWARLAVDDGEVVALDADGGPGLRLRGGAPGSRDLRGAGRAAAGRADRTARPADRSWGLYAGLAGSGIREPAGVDHPDVTSGTLRGPDGGL